MFAFSVYFRNMNFTFLNGKEEDSQRMKAEAICNMNKN